MSYSSTCTVNNLDDLTIIAGNNIVLTFDVIDDVSGSALDLGSDTIVWNLSPYGQPDVVILTKSGVIDSVVTGRFTVTLETSDTENLSGKYKQQPSITDILGESYFPAQGNVIIIPQIQ